MHVSFRTKEKNVIHIVRIGWKNWSHRILGYPNMLQRHASSASGADRKMKTDGYISHFIVREDHTSRKDEDWVSVQRTYLTRAVVAVNVVTLAVWTHT